LLIRTLVGIILSLAAIFAWRIYINRSQDMRPRLERVTHGMTLDQVIETVGFPPGDYSDDDPHFTGVWGFRSRMTHWWYFNDVDLGVQIEDGKVVHLIVDDHEPFHRPFERIRRLLHL
jgi:hypothetical protein